jgi:hypothetical protein
MTEHQLHDLIANRSWLHRAHPYPHIVARDVFTSGFYSAMADQLSAILDRGLSGVPAGALFSRGMRGYDAYGISLTEDLGEPLNIFVSVGWRDLICDLFAIGHTPYVFAGAHHHTPRSRDGFIHTDFNPVWFPRAEPGSIQIPDIERCDFKTGAGALPAEQKAETIRGAVVIFYLMNDGWQPGDGGETGLFLSGNDPISAPAVRCAPVNNSLVAFECTPQSYHAFLANAKPRTSIIMWVHRQLGEAVERYGEERIERWAT